MVFYFTSSDEDLIKYGWPEDIWFHVDKLSSAHVYLRLHKGQTVDDIPKEVLIDCAHLVKANSIQGCKMNNINVVYTPWTNLKKTADMDVGQIGFHRQKDVRTVTVEKKVNEILNRLEKTKVERFPDLAAEKEARDREERNEKKAQIQEMKRKEKEEMKKKKEMEDLRSYSSLMKSENMSSNQLELQNKSQGEGTCMITGKGSLFPVTSSRDVKQAKETSAPFFPLHSVAFRVACQQR
ncbi:coiled-coil domain-containing protein 25 isoform X2 [Gopherus flavomarginatus]|uniref:coiled-coil domain-containing protein 25 isoform X2 n=1 Tax=Gopherus flavomarginatus TaxID=286002 RepID=UPI0021CC0670|nr:coiled-coil domain-containing protein 25 isoform X2 [Gopherus flavomarginatus]